MNLINKHAIIVSSSLFTETQNAELNKLYNSKQYPQAISLASRLIQDDNKNILAQSILDYLYILKAKKMRHLKFSTKLF